MFCRDEIEDEAWKHGSPEYSQEIHPVDPILNARLPPDQGTDKSIFAGPKQTARVATVDRAEAVQKREEEEALFGAPYFRLRLQSVRSLLYRAG